MTGNLPEQATSWGTGDGVVGHGAAPSQDPGSAAAETTSASGLVQTPPELDGGPAFPDEDPGFYRRPIVLTPPIDRSPEKEAEKGPNRRRFESYLWYVDEALPQLAEAEESWEQSAALMEEVARDLRRERTMVREAFGGQSKTADAAIEAFGSSADELVAKADLVRAASLHFGIVRRQLEEGKNKVQVMDGKAADTPPPGDKPKPPPTDKDDAPEVKRETKRAVQQWEQQKARYEAAQQENEAESERQIQKLEYTYTEASKAMRAIHEVPEEQVVARNEPSGSGGGAAGGAGSGGAPVGGSSSGGFSLGHMGAGFAGAGLLGGVGVGAVKATNALTRNLGGAGAIGDGGRTGGQGVTGAGPGARAGGMPMRGGGGGGGGRGGGRGQRGAKNGTGWDDGEDWTDDEGLGPEVMQ